MTSIFGVIGVIPQTGSTGFTMFGLPATVTTTGTQRLTVSISAAMAVSTGLVLANIGPCYRSGTAVPQLLAGPNSYQEIEFGTQRIAHGFSATGIVPAGTYTVGLCIETNVPIDRNDWQNGWVMVTN